MLKTFKDVKNESRGEFIQHNMRKKTVICQINFYE